MTITVDTLTAKLREAEQCRENALQAASHWAGRAEQLRELLAMLQKPQDPPPPAPDAAPTPSPEVETPKPPGQALTSPTHSSQCPSYPVNRAP